VEGEFAEGLIIVYVAILSLEGEGLGRLWAGLVSGVWVLVLFVAVFDVTLNVPVVRASGTIYIKADGSINPSTAPIQRVGDVYTFTGNISDSIVVQRSNIIIDGNGYTLQSSAGSGNEGLSLYNINNVTIKNANIKGFNYGVYLNSTSHTVLFESNITNNEWGVVLRSSSYNTICGNNITWNHWDGIVIYYSSHNIIAGNNITENEYYGIGVAQSTYNTLSQNNVKNNSGYGISLLFSSYNSISGNDIINNGYVIDGSNSGVSLSCSSQNTISGNSIINDKNGMSLSTASNNNTISENIIANNGDGISIYYSSIYYPESVSGSGTYNTISENIIVSNNRSGISLSGGATDNIILHNSIAYNMKQADEPTYTNTWDDGARGNFWSDYNGADLDGDGIGDTPYVIDANNQDKYPLIVPLVWNYSNPIPVVWAGAIYPVLVSSNSTISGFKFNQPQMRISFNLTGPSGTTGYCNVTIPKALLRDNLWNITIDGMPKTDYVKTENDTHTFVYFTHTHASTFQIVIQGTSVIPEFPSVIILLLFMALSVLAVVFAERKFREEGREGNC
jgi:parallel beta-helix repeat protein